MVHQHTLQDVRTALDGLLYLCGDVQRAYQCAALTTHHMHLKALYTRYADQRERMMNQLAALVMELDGIPVSISVSLGQRPHHDGIAAARTEEGVLATVRRLDDTLRRTYEHMLHDNLPMYLYQTLIRQYDDVLRACSYLRLLAADRQPATDPLADTQPVSASNASDSPLPAAV